MPDFKFEGISFFGQSVHGIIQADNISKARKKIQSLASSRRFVVKKVLARRTFIYKAVKENNIKISGEQKAFTKAEVRIALERLGHTVTSVHPKLFDFRFKPPETEIVTFVRVSADMLREKLPFNEILQLLVNDIDNNSLREAIREINNDLHHGKDSEEAFVRQEKVLGKFTARMLGLASKSGNMVDIYESTATFLERNSEFKKSIKSALIMPLFTLLILFGAVLFYVAYIFPQTAELFLRMKIELPPMTAATLKASDFLVDNMVILSIITILIGTGIVFLLQIPKVQFFRDKYIFKIPIIGTLIHKTTIEIFCRVFYALYSGSGESVEAVRLSAEACGNKYMEYQIKTVAIPLMLSQGVGLVKAFESTGVFTKTALSRFHAGAETGTLKQAAKQIANYYQKETVYKLKNVVDFVQLIVAMVIMVVMTALTVVSTETAMIKPNMNK